MEKSVLILGAGIMQAPALRLARQLGFTTFAVDGSDKAPAIPLADKFFHIDLKDKEGILALAARLKKENALKGIMTVGTDFSTSAAFAAEKLGLPGVSYETALDASDKARMRKRFKEAGVPSPDFVVFSAEDEAAAGGAAKAPFPFPFVVKPVDNMGARGCRLARNEAEFQAALRDALRFSRSGRAIAEEYIAGGEYSIDAIVYKGRITITGFATRHIFFPPYFIEMGHTMGAKVSESKREEIISAFKAGVRALGIKNGAAKGDVKYGKTGGRGKRRAVIGEIAARLSGGFMSGWTYPYSSGVQPVAAAVRIACGEPPGSLKPKRDWVSAERAFISIPGKIREIYGAEEARSLKWVKDVFLTREKGDRVKFPENNVEKCGNVISAAPGRRAAISAAEKAARGILIVLEAPDKETDEFLLALKADFPPNAFNVDDKLMRALEKIPPSGMSAPARADSGAVYIHPFDAFVESDLKDYAGRSVAETIDIVRNLSGLHLETGRGEAALGREFWAAFIRGGYQGALYFLRLRCYNV